MTIGNCSPFYPSFNPASAGPFLLPKTCTNTGIKMHPRFIVRALFYCDNLGKEVT